MKNVISPLKLQMLLGAHCFPDYTPEAHLPASIALDEAVLWGISNGLISASPRNSADKPATYNITERGSVYISHLLATPLPVHTWRVPKGRSK